MLNRGDDDGEAPGAPGLSATWTSGAKDMVGGSLGPARLWFTLGRGTLNEIYYPRADMPQVRKMGFVVADGRGFWADLERLPSYRLRLLAPGVPAVEVLHEHPRFRLQLRITPDPRRDTLLVETALEGDDALRPYVLLAPHIGSSGEDNLAGIAVHEGRKILWAAQGAIALALAAEDEHGHDAIGEASAGYAGVSDGWQDFAQNGALRWRYVRAGPGNVLLTSCLPRYGVLALGFGGSREAAASSATAGLRDSFDAALQRQIADWQDWHGRLSPEPPLAPDIPEALRDAVVTSAMVLRTQLDKTHPGAMVASLSIPWGESGNLPSGYHLVWPRDLVQSAGGLLALGAEDEVRDILRYLISTQAPDGHWHQNYQVDGAPYWQAVQLDETALPVLLAAALAEREALDGIEVRDMAARALGYLLRHGPASEQDRWEDNPGITAFTLACCIAALVAGAAFLDRRVQLLALDVADFWNDNVERWLVAHGTELAAAVGVENHYVWTAPLRVLLDPTALQDPIPIRNHPEGLVLPAAEQVSVDFLQLVRFGLRAPDDPAVSSTMKIVDAHLKAETPAGPVWRRYVHDGYGEHDDGRPFDRAGRGRGWPLLTGERGHCAIAAGEDPLPYLHAMAAMAGAGGLMPEQVWDAAPIPSRRLFPGRPTGSAMPLAWAHAEFVKLVASRNAKRPVDRPAAVWRRYGGKRPASKRAFWSPSAPIGSVPAGSRLALLLPWPAQIRWSVDDAPANDQAASEAGFGLYAANLPTERLARGQYVAFTLRRCDGGEEIGDNYTVILS